MANVIKYNSRVVMKHDIKANWDKATGFIPLEGEIIVYTDLNRFKVGDGSNFVSQLPFYGEQVHIGAEEPAADSGFTLWLDTSLGNTITSAEEVRL